VFGVLEGVQLDGKVFVGCICKGQATILSGCQSGLGRLAFFD
jgi:hypothetical protein